MKKTFQTKALTAFVLITLVFCTQLVFAQESAAQVIPEPFENPKTLYKSLIDEKPELRSAALNYIQTHRPENVIPYLKTGILAYKRTILFNRIYDYRAVCLEALRLYPMRDTINDWIELLTKTGSAMLKIEIMSQISSTKNRNMVMPLTNELKNSFFEVRQAAARLLRTNGDDRVYPVILSMMTDESPAVRGAAIESLTYLYDQRFSSQFMNMLYDSDPIVRIHAIKCVRRNHIENGGHHVRSLASNDTNGYVRYAAFTYMLETGDRASVINIAIRAINDADRITRLSSVNVIYRFNATAGFTPLCYRLQSEQDDEIKETILDTLIARANVPYPNSIMKVLQTDTNPELRVKAAHALSFRNDVTSMQALIQSLNDKEPNVRAEACSSLATFQSAAATDALLRASHKNETYYVRTAALYALLRSKTRNATVGLFEIFADEDDPVFRSILYRSIRDLIIRYH